MISHPANDAKPRFFSIGGKHAISNNQNRLSIEIEQKKGYETHHLSSIAGLLKRFQKMITKSPRTTLPRKVFSQFGMG
jgi:hypothetical protein